jgi:hypothetical protein
MAGHVGLMSVGVSNHAYGGYAQALVHGVGFI